MKSVSLILLLMTSLMLMSCSTSNPGTRIEKNLSVYQKLSHEQQELVRKGEIQEGMTSEAVFLAWGHPDSKVSGQEKGQRFERWDYLALAPVYRNGFYGDFGMGFGHGPYRRNGRHAYPIYQGVTAIDYIPYPTASVEFQNNQVVSWQRGH